MTKKLTITVSDEVYEGLRRKIGPRRISRFIDGLARRHVLEQPANFRGSLADAYLAMAADEEAEREARDCTEGLIGETLPDEDSVTGPAIRRGKIRWTDFGEAVGGEIGKIRNRARLRDFRAYP
jgi:hypothetical protein